MPSTYHFSGGDKLVPAGVTPASGTEPLGNSGRILSNSYGLVRTATGSSEIDLLVSGATHGGTFYTRGVDGVITYPIKLVEVDDIDLQLTNATTIEILVGASSKGTGAIVLVDGAVNEISYFVDLTSKTAKITVNGIEVSAITIGNASNTATTLKIRGMNSDSGSYLMDIHTFEGGSTYPNFIECTQQAKDAIGTYSDMAVDGTIANQQSFKTFGTAFSIAPICAGYSPIQDKLFWIGSSSKYQVYDLTADTFSGGSLTIGYYGSGVANSAIYVPFDDRIYYAGPLGRKLAYMECSAPATQVETATVIGPGASKNARMIHCPYNNKIYAWADEGIQKNLHIHDLATGTADADIIIPNGAGTRNIKWVTYCPKNHTLYILVRDNAVETDHEMVKIDLVSAPTTVTDVITTAMGRLNVSQTPCVYNHFDNKIYMNLDDTVNEGVVTFDCGAETYNNTIINPRAVGNIRALQVMNEVVGGVTAFAWDALVTTYINGAHDIANDYTDATHLTTNSRVGALFVPERNSIFSGTTTTQYEYSLNTLNKFIFSSRASDGGSVVSVSQGDKTSLSTTQDISADALTTRKMIGMNVNSKGILSTDGSKARLGFKDVAGEATLGAEVTLSGTPQDLIESISTNSAGGTLSVADVDALEPIVEAR